MIPPLPGRRLLSPLIVSLALLALATGVAGCAIFGVAAQALPEPKVPARYSGLRGHSVAVLAWAPRGLETDYPALRLDLVAAIQSRLQAAQQARKAELKDATFPHAPASLVRFQEDHPELERSPVVTVAPRLGVQRLIYIELENFQTRSDQSVELYRGSATISLQVVEVEGGQATVGFAASGLTTIYPPNASAEGVPNADDARIYRGTVDLLATSVAHQFYAHESGK
jgi:hypothetical protein